MTLGEHFREFRNRLVKSALAVLVLSVVGWVVYDRLVTELQQPLFDYVAAHPDRAGDIKTTFTGLMSAFSLHLSLSVIVGVILASPVWLYQLWAFIVPGLTKRERRVSRVFIAAAVPLFLLGILLAHRSIRLVVGVLLDFTPKGTANYQGLTDYINFVARFSLGFGFAFLLPVFLVGLNFAGVLPTSAMVRSWRLAVFLIFAFSAMMMPTPDPYSMMILALPLCLFYFAAIGIGKILDRRRSAERPEWLDTADDETSAL